MNKTPFRQALAHRVTHAQVEQNGKSLTFAQCGITSVGGQVGEWTQSKVPEMNRDKR